MTGETKALMWMIGVGLVLMYSLGVWVGKRMECECPPPPAVEVCRLELPKR